MMTRRRSPAADSSPKFIDAMTRVAGAILAAAWVLVASAGPLRAASLSESQDLQRPPLRSMAAAEPSGQTATFVFFNRAIIVLRARVLGREPAERVESATHIVDDLARRHIVGPVSWRPFEGGALITVDSRSVLAVTAPDVDELSGETVESAAAAAAVRLQQALNEAIEARSPRVLLRESALALGALILAGLIMWGIGRAHRAATRKVVTIAERTVTQSGIADLDALRASRILDLERWILAALAIALHFIVVYATIGYVLRRFPYTRAWGESMRGFLMTTLQNLLLGIATAVPGLLTVALIFFIARFLVRLIGVWFKAVERGQLKPRWLYPETAQPTRRLLTGLVWVFAVAITYPYLPGSQTDAFKGASVFLGLMVTIGSSGLVNQLMSGFMITYSRALRQGDFVRIGDIEGTVIHLGVLSTKVRTVRHEEVTIPNAVVVSQTTTDFSRLSEFGGVFTPTSVTIGYDAPWRQVHALLLLAAERTPGLRRAPKPEVVQEALEDFYVRYTLLVCLESQELRLYTLDTLHAHIQDLFNEHGVQIMSPNYVVDPAAPKVVPKKDWFAAPASAEVQRRPAS
jgi:small-conductance mechanosensitive channel